MATKSTNSKSAEKKSAASSKKATSGKNIARKIERKSGVAVPLGALHDKKYPVIGEYPALADLARFCRKAGLKIIQLLPVNDTGTQSSPYSGLSAFALHPIYVCLEALPEFAAAKKADRTLVKNYAAFLQEFSASATEAASGTPRYDYDGILNAKTGLLRQVFATTEIYEKARASAELEAWLRQNGWLCEYAVFKNLKWKYMQASSKSWKKADRNLSPEEIQERWKSAGRTDGDKDNLRENLFYAWVQLRAAGQFAEGVAACRRAGILVKGDLPILLNEDSCDVWAHPDLFNSRLRAGSPPDGENPTGQNWGFPIYDWAAHKKGGYAWWQERVRNAQQYYDAFRLDHVIGFFRIWAVPERETTALLGHTEPFCAITVKQLEAAGFDGNRIRWLAEPHVPTGLIQDITWNYEAAHKIMAKWLDKLDGEELWLFKKSVKGDRDIYETKIAESECSPEAADRIKASLAEKWRDRALVEASKGKFVPLWTYAGTTAWQSLDAEEKAALAELFGQAAAASEKKWRAQADEIFAQILGATEMTACGEDLGANPACLPEVLEQHGILGLRVVRWTRDWAKAGQPYVPFADYTPLSVVTASVHDSTTLRGWWEKEQNSAENFIADNLAAFGGDKNKGQDAGQNSGDGQKNAAELAGHGTDNEALARQRRDEALTRAKEMYAPFSREIAGKIFAAVSESASVWQIHPLVDYLYLSGRYNLANSDDERVNVPGTVTAFNWTWRLPAELSVLAQDEALCGAIAAVAKAHDGA